ncbi:MAG TPA: DUF4430 domain-containing protein [Candidatus Ligilactobacillus excrementipullorum]|nr:DUF4430 domain-containing protein [Candidatus Ligilactobacillus excrementipullorum]
MKKSLMIIVTLLATVVLASCAGGNQTQQPQEKTLRVSYQLKHENKALAKKTVTVKPGSNVLQGLKKAWNVKLEQQMVTEIKGHAQNPDLDEYWVYEVNGKEAKKGVTEQKLHNKDHVVFILKDISK